MAVGLGNAGGHAARLQTWEVKGVQAFASDLPGIDISWQEDAVSRYIAR